jgi:hypothetical protein
MQFISLCNEMSMVLSLILNRYLATLQTIVVLTSHPTPPLPAPTTWSYTVAHEASFPTQTTWTT